MSLRAVFGGGGGWTIATILVAGIIFALFISEIADIMGYGIAASINATSSFHKYAVEGLNGSESSILYTGQAGQYTYVITKPGTSSLGTLLGYILYLLPALISILTDPRFLIILIGASLIYIAYEMEVK